MALVTVGLCTTLVGSACSSSDPGDPRSEEPARSAAQESTTTESSTLGEPSEVYADHANWLCRPDVTDDACDVDLDATLVHPDGSTEPEPFVAATDAPVDCFYVYPTISTDEGRNSDLIPGESERGVAAGQAARFGEVCNVYAPMYRQIPLGALMDRLSGTADGDSAADEDSAGEEDSAADEETGGPLGGAPGEIAYGDVREAFMHYLAEDNDGRPFVLIGHSQGAAHLSELVAQEIDGNEALRSRMSSAMLIGGAIAASGESAYERIPACGTPTDTGCVISYSSFYEGEPPPSDSLFGRVRGVHDGRAICTNPADPAARDAVALQSYFKAGHAAGAPVVDTPYLHYDGLITGRCTSDDAFDWFEIARNTSADPALPNDLGGRITPQWGAHLADVDFAIGDLINLVRSQNNLG